MGNRRRSPGCACHRCLIMAFILSSKSPLFRGKRLHYQIIQESIIMSDLRLVWFVFKTHIKRCLKKAFLRTAQCCPSLKYWGGFVSLFRVTMAALFDVRLGFYLCNQRRGSALRWDKLITLFSEPLNQDKRKLTPQSSLSHSCALCCALSELYLSQHNVIREAISTAPTTSKREKSALQNVQLKQILWNPPKEGEIAKMGMLCVVIVI